MTPRGLISQAAGGSLASSQNKKLPESEALCPEPLNHQQQSDEAQETSLMEEGEGRGLGLGAGAARQTDLPGIVSGSSPLWPPAADGAA